MSTTARDLIKASFQLLGILAAGESPQADEAKDALATMRRMLDSWSIERLMVYASARESFPLAGGQASYTMGLDVTADFNTARAVEIVDARIVVTGSNPPLEIPMDILNDHEWANVMQKSTPGSFPTKLHPNGTYPLDTLDVWPVPSSGCSIVLYSKKPLSAVTSLDTVIVLPPGYEDTIVTNLAVKIAPIYGRAVTQDLMSQAMDAKGNVKRQNIKPEYLECDSALLGNSRGGYDILTDGN